MKKTLVILLIFISTISFAQKKDSTAKDTVIVLSVQQANQIIEDIQIQMSGKADVKNDQWMADLKIIFGSAHISDKPQTTK